MANDPDAALTGAAYDLDNAGFRLMPDPHDRKQDVAIGSDSAALREAAAQRSDTHDRVIAREYIDADGEPASASEAVTLDRAARDYASATMAETLALQNESSKTLAARVDAMRAEAWAGDPATAEFYGFEPPAAKTDTTPSGKTAAGEPTDNSGHTIDGLDPELAKALDHPQVVQAIEERIGEAEKARQSYVDGLTAATHAAQASFLSQFPELASVAPESLPAVLELMARQDPAKFARVQAMIATSDQLIAQHRQEGRRQAELTQQNFQRYAKSEDARLETMLKGESKETQRAVSAEILASAAASGVEAAEMMRLFNSEPLMRNAVFQRMMYDAGKYRLMMKARDAAVAKAVPPVQRPGLARTAAEREHADLRSLNARLSSSGDIKDAVALYNARKSSKR